MSQSIALGNVDNVTFNQWIVKKVNLNGSMIWKEANSITIFKLGPWNEGKIAIERWGYLPDPYTVQGIWNNGSENHVIPGGGSIANSYPDALNGASVTGLQIECIGQLCTLRVTVKGAPINGTCPFSDMQLGGFSWYPSMGNGSNNANSRYFNYASYTDPAYPAPIDPDEQVWTWTLWDSPQGTPPLVAYNDCRYTNTFRGIMDPVGGTEALEFIP